MISESLRAQLRDAIYDEVTKNSFTAEDSVVDLLDEIIRLRERLAACERVVEAAIAAQDKDVWDMNAHALYQAVEAYRAAVAAETCARSAPITVGDTQGETCAKCGGSGYAIDTERSGVGRVVGKKCDCGSVAYITNGTPTLHAGGTDA
jgi:hypothetical protein